jgi:hypothetical protein
VKERLSAINILAVVAVCLMAAAMFYPWWSIWFEGNVPTDIYPHLIDGPASEFIGYKRSTQMKILTYALAVSIGLAVLGSVLRGKAGRIVLVLASLVSLYGTYRLVGRISLVADRYGIPLHGSAITYEEFAPTRVTGTIRPGLPLMAAGGALCLVAALLHNRARLGSSQDAV